ncbi:MAG: EAL domain-containing protein [Lachnospiraceae bacterium]|nr:EAL domain-containing protein [Lachnospiraceae bacterium]
MNSSCDYLTGLLGTGEFIRECERIVSEGGRRIAFITNDISNFKYVNDLYSMEEGDRFINEMAHFFFIDNPSCLAACRTGCDQFRGLFDIKGLTREEETQRITDMNSEFEKRMSEKYPNIFFHVYTGIYFWEDGEQDVRMAIDRAHLAKKLTKGKFNIKCQVYSPADFRIQTEQMEVSNMFIRACDNDDILVYLQPKFSVSQNRVVGAEALARIDDGKGGVIPPGRFIPVLEMTGMVGKLDEIMIEKVFALQKRWLNAGYETFPISINVSPVEFSKETFADKLIAMQQQYEVPPELIELEVLESTVMDAVEAVVESINKLREYGFKVSVDDFGSGYSSLNQIADIPADIIKIDRVFASKGLYNEKGKKVVRALIRMLHDIEYSIVFEGIETQEERDLAYEYGCDVIQGFYYSKPMPMEEFEKKYFPLFICE